MNRTKLSLAVTNAHQPMVVAYGMGVDSTAMLVGMIERGIRVDAILFANTGGEKDETMAYLPVMNEYLQRHGYPTVTVVTYVPQDFKNYPPYYTLEQNCLTNGTLPSEAFGFGSCSLKWKAQPQEAWIEQWQPAQAAWAAGIKVTRAIGYDDSGADCKRSFKAGKLDSSEYDQRFFLQEWGWDRLRCKEEIAKAGLPVPPKSSCFFCPNMTPAEVSDLDGKYLRRIVLMETRAKPRLEGYMTQEQLDAGYAVRMAKWKRGEEQRKAKGKGKAKPQPRRRMVGDPGLVKGLWRSGVKGVRDPSKKRPALMTDYIRAEGLLPAGELDALIASAPVELVRRAERFGSGLDVDSWDDVFGNLAGECSPITLKPAKREFNITLMRRAA